MNLDDTDSMERNHLADDEAEPEAISQVADRDLSDRGHVIDGDEAIDSKKSNTLLYAAIGVGSLIAVAGIWFLVLAPQVQQAQIVPVSVMQPIQPQELQVGLPATPEETPSSGVVSVQLDIANSSVAATGVISTSTPVPVRQPEVTPPVTPPVQAQETAPIVAEQPKVIVQPALVAKTASKPARKIKKRAEVAVGTSGALPTRVGKKTISTLYELYAIKDGRAWVRELKTDDVIMVMVGDPIPGHGIVRTISDDRIEFDEMAIE